QLGESVAAEVCGSTILGFDISHYQINTDWQAASDAGKVFAIVKATEGMTYIDPDFDTNWSGMKEAGLIRGAYHFFHPEDDPIKQADHFTNVIGALGSGDLPGALDLEVTDGESPSRVASTALSFLKRVEANTGKTPMIYTSPAFFSSSAGNPAGF